MIQGRGMAAPWDVTVQADDRAAIGARMRRAYRSRLAMFFFGTPALLAGLRVVGIDADWLVLVFMAGCGLSMVLLRCPRCGFRVLSRRRFGTDFFLPSQCPRCGVDFDE